MLTSTSQDVQDFNRSFDRMISGPNNSVAVKHPRIVFFQEAFIVRGRREPNTHVEFEEDDSSSA